MNGNRIGEDVLNNTNTYLAAYGVILVGSFLLISIDGLSMTTNVSAVAACFNNIGPGFDVVGPTCNFSVYSWFSKLVLILTCWPEDWKFSRCLFSFQRVPGVINN